MLKELFDAICTQAVKAQAPIVVSTPEPAHRYLLAKADGSCEMMEADPPPRQHKALDLATITELAQQYADGEAEEGECSRRPVVWFSREAVVLFLDDATRRDVVKLPLLLHVQLRTLGRLEKDKPVLDQKQFIRLLKIDLANCDPSDGPMLQDLIRTVRFKKQENGESVVLHTKASIGRSLETELMGACPIPETIILSVPVFSPPYHKKKHLIACSIEIDPATEKFQLIPFPGEIEKAICLAEEDIGDILISSLGDMVPVYYGNP